ncbi:MAG: hypothetical protein WKF43_02400 [Acidimicrobiales bacterium]
MTRSGLHLRRRGRPDAGQSPVPRWMVALALVVAVALGACKVETTVDVAVEEDGSGTVTVTARLDADAAKRAPDLDQTRLVDDLRATGWRITGPDRLPGGGLEVAASHSFRRAAELTSVMAQLTGRAGPFRRFTLERSHSFARTRYRLAGTVDLSAGIDAFGDDELRALLGGQTLGRTQADFEREIGSPLAGAAPVRVRVRLPGGGTQEWNTELGADPVTIDATSSQRAPLAWLFAFAAGLAAAGFLATVLLIARYNRIHRPPSYLHRPGGRRRPWEG